MSNALICGEIPVFSATVSLSRARWMAFARNTFIAACVSGAGAVASPVFAQKQNSTYEVTANAPDMAPTMLIESMSVALRTLNYEGSFVHAQGTNLTSMHILHASGEQGEFERLTALDGEAREVIRNNSLVTCIWPGSQSVVVSKSKPRDLLPRVDASLVTNNRYEFSHGAQDRVAGRATYVVNVAPRDEFRYGYRFWIDTENYMLLRSMLLEGPDKPVEQVIFTQIAYPGSIEVSRFDILGRKDRSDIVSWLEPEKVKASSNSAIEHKEAEEANRISFSSLPAGYQKVSETYSSMSFKKGPVSHAMLTDGMASVSVYIEYEAAVEQNSSTLGLSRMGAMNAFGIRNGAAMVTAVGEVPEATVRAIAAAVTLSE